MRDQIAASNLALGRVVAVGDILVELNSDSERLALDDERARHGACKHEMTTLRSEIAAQELALQGELLLDGDWSSLRLATAPGDAASHWPRSSTRARHVGDTRVQSADGSRMATTVGDAKRRKCSAVK